MNLPVDPATLWLFIPAALILNLTPGNDMLLCLSKGLSDGPRAGIAASLGVSFGVVIHTLVAAFGLAALLAAHPVAFSIIRWAGIAYLLFLAWHGIFRPSPDHSVAATQNEVTVAKVDFIKHFRQGLVVNLLNPKVALFILAFLPQFVDASKGSTIAQFLFLGAIPIISGTIINSIVGVYAGRIGALVKKKGSNSQHLSYLSSVIFVALALRLASEH